MAFRTSIRIVAAAVIGVAVVSSQAFAVAPPHNTHNLKPKHHHHARTGPHHSGQVQLKGNQAPAADKMK